MNAASILCGLLSTFGGPVVASGAAPGHESPIEIVIAGPEQARNQLAAAIRPLLGSDLDVRWVAQNGISPDRVFPAPGGPTGNEREIWIDVSSPVRLRVYLPASATQGATTIRTLPRAGAARDGSDSLAIEAVAQIVKAAILSLRRDPTAATGLSPPPADASSAIISKRPETAKGPSDSSPSGAHLHDGLFLRFLAGYGSLRASQSTTSGSFDHYGPTIGLAVGASLPRGFILYGELRINGNPTSTETEAYPTNPSFMLYTFGPGVAYYFDSNLYVSGTLGLTKLAFTQPTAGPDYSIPDPDLGYSATVTAGKEWWVSPDWAVGFAGQYSLASMSDYRPTLISAGAALHVTSLSLLLSATYD